LAGLLKVISTPVSATLSSRHLLPGSISELVPAFADGWIPVTSTGVTVVLVEATSI
jgi:hypothetical protein